VKYQGIGPPLVQNYSSQPPFISERTLKNKILQQLLELILIHYLQTN
jgi:hypothetical protein